MKETIWVVKRQLPFGEEIVSIHLDEKEANEKAKMYTSYDGYYLPPDPFTWNGSCYKSD